MQMLAKSIATEIYLLCFDEIQITDATNLSLISYLFSYLYQYGVVIIGTSNRELDDLFKGYLDRNKLVLQQLTQIISLYSNVIHLDTSIDFRLKSLKDEYNQNEDKIESPYFMSPNNSENNTKLTDTWNNIIQNDTDNIVSDSIPIYGREIKINKAHKKSKSAYFNFKDICEELYGPNDYIYLANEYENIFVENIPKLSVFTQKNEARRFIWLIDAMYECKCKLYATSERNSDELFLLDDTKMSEDNIDIMQKEMIGDLFGESKDLDDITLGQYNPKIDQMVREQQIEAQKFSSTIFSGEEELFAFKRAISRIKEMGTKKYMQNIHVKNKNIILFKGLKPPKSIPPRHEWFGLSIYEKFMIPKKQPTFKEHHWTETWGIKGSGEAKRIRDEYVKNRDNNQSNNV